MARGSKKTGRKKAGTGVARRRSGAVTDWKAELIKEAEEEAEVTPLGSGNVISLRRNGQFRFQGTDIGDELEVVVTGHILNNKWYDSEYDEDNITPPACFALGVKVNTMAPHDTSPNKQNEICEGCWANEWGSVGGTRRGKACAEKIKLAVAYADDTLGDSTDEIFLEIPPTSTGAFNKYVTKLTRAKNIPSWAVVTKITFDEHADHQMLIFAFVSEVPEKLLSVCKTLNRTARVSLLEPPDVSGYKKPKATKAAKSNKKTGKKKTGRRTNGGKATKKRSRFSA